MSAMERGGGSRGAMRCRQALTVARLELRKSLLSLRALWVYLLAFAPTALITLHAVVSGLREGGARHGLDEDTEILAGIFHFYYLRLGIFFGCLGIFTRLYRGEMMERSAHHYLLAPLRREVVALGKFLAGLVATALPFCLAVIASFVAMYSHFGDEARRFFAGGPGLGHLTAYVAATALACVGYGAVFLLIGLLVRNPILPAVVVLGWESINHVLPASLKLLSIVFYLAPLLPVEPPAPGLAALIAVPADPIAPWLAVPGLLAVSAAILTFACLRARRTEIDYSGD